MMYLQRRGLVLVVLGVGLEVVDVNVGQARDEQLELLLVEDANEPLGDDVVEALEEGVQLLADGTRHLHLAHEPDVFHLVLLGDGHVAAVRFQIARLRHAKLLHLRRERQVIA